MNHDCNMLIDYLPETVEIEGVEYEIESNFRTFILFEMLMQDSELSDSEKAMQGLEGASEVQRIYSFEHDDDYIYSAFLTQYHIDLQDIKYLHWWKFKALLRTLSSDLEFCKIMEYRSVDINANMTKEQRDFYRRKKELYALPLPADEEEKVDAIAEALMNGGDLTGLL